MKNLNKLASFAIVGVFILSFLACGVTKEEFELEKRPPFKISQVYNQQWASGIRNGASGEDLYISLEKFNRRDADITFQQLFFKNQVANLQKPSEYRNQYTESVKHYVAYFRDGKTNDVYLSPDSEQTEKISLDQFPFELTDQEAVVSYRQFGKTHYYKIPYVRTVARMGYPAMNPNDMEERTTDSLEDDMDK